MSTPHYSQATTIVTIVSDSLALPTVSWPSLLFLYSFEARPSNSGEPRAKDLDSGLATPWTLVSSHLDMPWWILPLPRIIMGTTTELLHHWWAPWAPWLKKGKNKERKVYQLTTCITDLALVAVVPKAKLKINGPTKSWEGKGSSGKAVHRIFCSECGSPIAHDPDAAPEIIAIKAGTLDVEIKKKLQPDTEIWTKSKLPFVKESLAKPFTGMPE